MATLSASFPSSRTISPSVRIVEKDNSFYGNEQGFSIPGLVGFASKGPINTPTRVRNVQELWTTFGPPDPRLGSYLIYCAEQLVQDAEYAWVTRVADTTVGSSTEATTAEVIIPSAGQAAYVLSGIADGTPVVIDDTNDTFRYRVNGVLSDEIVRIPQGSYANLIGSTNSIQAAFTEQFGADPILAAESHEDGGNYYLKIRVRNVYGTQSQIELVSTENSIYSTLGMGSNMTAAELTGTADRYPSGASTATFNLGSMTSPTIDVIVFGTGNGSVDGVLQSIYLKAADGQDADAVVDVINGDDTYDGTNSNSPMGFFARNDGGYIELVTGNYNSGSPLEMVGRDAKLIVRPSSTADTALGLSNLAVVGTSPEGDITDDTTTLGIVSGVATGGAAGGSFTVEADSVGTIGNLTQVEVSTDPEEGTITIKVYNNSQFQETFGGMHKDETRTDQTYYIENVVNQTSNWIQVTDNTDTEEGPLPGVYSLSGGTDGIPASSSDQADLLVGTAQAESGLYAMSNPEAFDVDLVAIPGVSTTRVINSMIDFCENQRQDCMAIIDPPFGMTADDVVQWHNGSHFLNLTRFDSSYGAIFWPWVQVRDKYNGLDVWLPPSGNVMGAFAITTRDYGAWFAVAGAERGVLNRVLDVEVVPYLADRDRLYGNENAINPIIKRPGGDVVIWGNKTLQRAQSALDRINVRRLVFYVKKEIQDATDTLLFAPHTEQLRNSFTAIASNILGNIAGRDGLYDFDVQCDEELNPPDVIDRNEMRARIGIQPTKAMEFLFIELTLQRTGGEPDTL